MRTLVRKLRRKLSQCVNGLWVPPGHFYSPIPSLEEVRRHEREIFCLPWSIPGVDLREDAQLELLGQFRPYYQEMPFTAGRREDLRYYFDNPAYSYSDAICLYGMIRHLRPRRIIEVGSGHSSCVILDTNERFFGNGIACTFIEPYPDLFLSLLKAGDRERVRLIDRPVQQVDLGTFAELSAGDILFIDSTHVAKIHSDVNHLVFNILPALAAGVSVHFHDIMYPFEYCPEWVYEGRAWNEAYLLRAFLQYNRAFRIQLFTSYLHRFHRDLFRRNMPLCLKNPGASLWIQRVEAG